MEKSKYKIRNGALLQDVINADNSKTVGNSNMTDELAEYHLLTNPDCKKHFVDLPFDIDEQLAKKREKIFIVHGHNDKAKIEIAQILKKYNIEPIILHEQPDKGRTIIEKLEQEAEGVSFAIILLTKDDVMSDNYRARQNVMFEYGYFIAKLGKNRVLAIYDNPVEKASDLSGILYKELSGNLENEIYKELKAAGVKMIQISK
ncbi:MAG: nucleotide-binding protein [Paludibacter sp.]|nr:nucleotide-binding protein [Paludibacter sp.]